MLIHRLKMNELTKDVPSRYSTVPEGYTDTIEDTLGFVLERIDGLLDAFDVQEFPGPASEELVYEPVANDHGWTTSFWTGMLWLAYEATGEERYREVAQSHLESFSTRLEQDHHLDHHDLGFLYTLSGVAGHKLTGNREFREMALKAADRLTGRYRPEPGVVQAWGDISNPEERPWADGRIIADTMLNLPLLYWADETTDRTHYGEMAASHATRTAERIVRDDGSTFHTFQFDPTDGEPLGGETHQGHADDSCWSRGQAWAIYGFPLSYRYTGDKNFIRTAKHTAQYYLAHLPEDDVPCWDLDLQSSDPQRDSSAAAIAVCGLDELVTQLPIGDESRPLYRNAAIHTLVSLCENYTAVDTDSNGVLDHGVYSKPGENGVDECCIWGDYFFFEALVRATRNWEPYW